MILCVHIQALQRRAGPRCRRTTSRVPAIITAAANTQPADAAKPGINRPPLTALRHNGSVASQQATETLRCPMEYAEAKKVSCFLLLYAFLVFCTSAKQLARLLTKNNAI